MKPTLSRARLVELLEACEPLAIGVVGDFSLDSYWHVDMTRAQLSREAPLYIRPVVREAYTLGGAANVAWNLAALGVGEVHAFTVLGHDWRGDLLRRALADVGVDSAHILTHDGWASPLFGKIVLEGHGNQQEDARLDFVNTEPLPPNAEGALVSALEGALARLQGLVVADYQPVGIITGRVRAALNSLAARYPRVVFLADSREGIAGFHHMALKPNEVEATRVLFPGCDPGIVSLADLARSAPRLQAKADARPLYVTLGAQGCLVYTQEGCTPLPAVTVPSPIDSVGAGDTFAAAVAAGLAAGADPIEAGLLATLAAAVTVRKLHVTGTATPAEILDLFSSLERDERWP